MNLRDAIRRKIDFETGGKSYKLVENPAVLIVRYAYRCELNIVLAKGCVTDLGDGIWTSPA